MKKLTKEKVIQAVNSIENSIDDPEEAHWKEDALYADFISCISKGLYSKKEAAELATIILKTADIKFPRWYA